MFNQPHSRILRRFSSILMFACLFFIVGVHPTMADEIAIWNFNDSDLLVDHGTGTLTATSCHPTWSSQQVPQTMPA